MNCPRCVGGLLQEREREGIVVDACESCRGVWLDRGELEKLVARATREIDELTRNRDDARPHAYRPRDDERYHRDPRRKRRWFETLGDLFD